MSNLGNNLLRNIRYWRFKRDLLWFGDKCYHMVNHSFNHTWNDWNLANQILPPLIQYRRNFLSSEELYSFSMAIWLHDIGHKGNERYGEAYQIRDNHGLISGEIILTNPENFNIYQLDNYYKGLKFPVGNMKKSLPQMIMEREIPERRMTIPEMIALLSIYHKSNTPITRTEANLLFSKNRLIPIDYFRNCDIKKDVITLQDICEKRLNRREAKKFVSLAVLFRLIDSLDISKNRVGDSTEEKIKKSVINWDKEYLIEKVNKEARLVADKLGKNNSAIKMLIYKTLGGDIVEKLNKNEKIDIENIKRIVGDEEELYNYLSCLFFAYFVSVQTGHFDLHSSVDKVEINLNKYRGIWNFIIDIYSNRKKEDLKKLEVKELGKPSQSIFERLIGKEENDLYGENSYFYSEISNSAEHLKEIFVPAFSLRLVLHLPSPDRSIIKDKKNFF